MLDQKTHKNTAVHKMIWVMTELARYKMSHPIYLAETYNKQYLGCMMTLAKISTTLWLQFYWMVRLLDDFFSHSRIKIRNGKTVNANSMKIFNEFGKEIRNNFHKMAYQRFDPKQKLSKLNSNTESLLSFPQELKKLAANCPERLSKNGYLINL